MVSTTTNSSQLVHNDCSGCEECIFSEPQTELIYEIHITVDNDKYFIETCYEFGVKPIIIDMGSNIAEHVMTSSTHRGNDSSAMSYAFQLKKQFEDRKFNVSRVKIETVPWHPCASNPQPNQYFETHFAVKLHKNFDDFDVVYLENMAKMYDLHKSRNLLKRDNDDRVQMFTYRRYNVDSRKFLDQIEIIEKYFGRNNFELEKVITEFALYDSNTSLDNQWLSKSLNQN